MKLYRFSPIKSEQELLAAIEYIHEACYKLCKQSFGVYLPNAGNVGVFCHFDDEYDFLVGLRNELTKPSNTPDLKYYELLNPITISARDDVPETTYTHLYIRKPDPYRHHVGDIDFYLDQKEYEQLRQSLLNGDTIKRARIFARPDLDMVELYDPDIDALAYISTTTMTEKVRIKLPDSPTKL